MKRHHALLIGLSMAWALMLGTPTLAAQRVPASAIEAAPDARAALATLDALAGCAARDAAARGLSVGGKRGWIR